MGLGNGLWLVVALLRLVDGWHVHDERNQSDVLAVVLGDLAKGGRAQEAPVHFGCAPNLIPLPK